MSVLAFLWAERMAVLTAILLVSSACVSQSKSEDYSRRDEPDSGAPHDSGQDTGVDDSPYDLDEDNDGSPSSADCDDHDPSRFPEAVETCDGVDNNCDGIVDVPVVGVTHSSVQTAIDGRCPPLGQVLVPSGTYRENITVEGNALNLAGTGAESDGVVIDGSGCIGADCSVLAIRGEGDASDLSLSVSISGITLTGGGGDSTCRGGDSSDGESCGGGINCDRAILVLRNVVVRDNTASSVGGGIFAQNCRIDAVGGQVSKNRAGFDGGGVYVADSPSSTTSFSGVEFASNQAKDGGALLLSSTAADGVVVNGCRFRDNLADGLGGAIAAYSPLILSDTDVSGNRTSYSDGPGGVYCRDTVVGVLHSTIAENDPRDVVADDCEIVDLN